MEKLQKDQSLRFTMPDTFGGGVAIIHLNRKRETIHP